MDGLKQRIIGALVLVSLAVIFVPMMFDEPHSERQTTTIEIPEEPPFPEIEMPEEEPAQIPQYHIEEVEKGAGKQLSGAEPIKQPVETADTATAPEVAEPDSTAQQAEVQAAAENTLSSEATAAEFTRSLEGAWVVQLGSFGSKENATRLQANAREKGYSTHLQQISRGEAEMTRVFSGPFSEKAEADKAKKALDAAFGLNTLVTSGGK